MFSQKMVQSHVNILTKKNDYKVQEEKQFNIFRSKKGKTVSVTTKRKNSSYKTIQFINPKKRFQEGTFWAKRFDYKKPVQKMDNTID